LNGHGDLSRPAIIPENSSIFVIDTIVRDWYTKNVAVPGRNPIIYENDYQEANGVI